MAPVINTPNPANVLDEAPMSRTHQYRKIMKPLLERKRRARINSCLDELKELMVDALQSEGESINKLEKADVLELTVTHLRKLKRQQMLAANPALDMDRYRAGFSACASEVSRFMSSVPGVNITFGTSLMGHLGAQVSDIDRKCLSPPAPLTIKTECGAPAVRPHLPLSPISDGGYTSGRDASPSPPLSVGSPSPPPAHMRQQASPVWRPF